MNDQDLVGVTLGNNTLEREIGRGGMATVYLAQQSRPTRTVAVKVLQENQAANTQQFQVFQERFRREADTIARLEHKNILPIYEYSEAVIQGKHLTYIVMPYIRGGTLRQKMDDMRREGKQFDLQTVADYIRQIADALTYAHSLGIVHRDIKPANLLFHSDGRLLLSDFGIVHVETMSALTMPGFFIGTPEYASPEQAGSQKLDARSDIYSLGIILYELLTGSVPYTGTSPFDIMLQHMQKPVPSVRAVRPDLSPAIEFVVKKALAKDPKDRYQQASELAADFEAAVRPALTPGLRLGGDAGNADLTVADSSWQPAAAPVRSRGATTPMPALRADASPAAGNQRGLLPLPGNPQPPQPGGYLPTEPLSLPTDQAGQAQAQLHLSMPDLQEASDQVRAYRTGRRLFFYIIGLITLLAQFVMIGLIIGNAGKDASAVILGVLLGNVLNLLALVAICFTGVVRKRDLRGTVNRVIWTLVAALILSGFFISYGEVAANKLDLPLVSYVILLITNIFSIRELSRVDAPREQIEVAPIYWNPALIGALTGLLPLTLILVFAMLAPLSWTANSSSLLRLWGILLVGLIGAPTPGSMMAVWLSHRMSFPILLRTSGIAGMFMFVAAYLLVMLASLIITHQPLFIDSFSDPILIMGIIIMGVALGLIGLLRGMLDAWIYHRVVMRRP